MPLLKGVIFSLRDVIVKEGAIDKDLLSELGKLVAFLKSRGVQPVFVMNRPWTAKSKDGTERDLKDVLAERWGEMPWYVALNGDMPFKPKAAAMERVLSDMGWRPCEAIYVGSTEDDMITARNGKLMFLNAQWHSGSNPYGYQFSSPKDIARFVDCFCLGFQDWFWALEDRDLRVYSLAPFSTFARAYSDAWDYSSNAKETAKHLGGDATFWGRLLAASVYLSGLVEKIDYIASYPGHSVSSAQPVISEALTILAQSLRKTYIPDLIVRHVTAPKSQSARNSGQSVDPLNQINSIHLNSNPIKNSKGDRYAKTPLKKGKTVLIVDDFCTEGNAFEAGRAYVQATGAGVICLSWLKTINRDYLAFSDRPTLNPYEPNILGGSMHRESYYYSSHIKNRSATADLNQIFGRYYQWDWPE
ncbi:HAD family hydrolase [Methylobacterium sp. Leaf89]|uniref:HAD family hydrolase n=1 Tax=Methylobacterium sp. Leaf89 TaxID=1736245 RepID=UPI000A7F8559|nr:HAD family hydrolase [Methylobacterium sp. Leaf89]